MKDTSAGASGATAADPAADRASAADRAPQEPHAVQYEPPAIAWEEPFEAMAATSCALEPLDASCLPRPTV